MQKGLSAQNLATPSIGGSMNIVTDAAALERGGSFKQEVGAWIFEVHHQLQYWSTDG